MIVSGLSARLGGLAAAVVGGVCGSVVAGPEAAAGAAPGVLAPAEWVVWEGVRPTLEYATGDATLMPVLRVWRPACGSEEGAMGPAELAGAQRSHEAAFADPTRVTVVGGAGARAGLDVSFVIGAGVPSQAVAALTVAHNYLQAAVPYKTMTVTVNVSFASLPAGVLGATSPTYGYVSYAGSRSGLIAGAGDNTIMGSLPTPTLPVRYTTGATTAENRVIWTTANYRATVGSVSGADANMQFSTNFAFDYDPSNGISAGTTSFVDVVIHEVCHALGVTSGVGVSAFNNDVTTMDIFRFRYADYYPDTYANFTSVARWRVYNNGNPYFKHIPMYGPYQPIPVEDGSPYQAGHLRQGWGLMSPAIGTGVTYGPNYINTPLQTVLDYLGYDFPGPAY